MTTKTHGYWQHPQYKRWRSIVQRCTEPTNKSYKCYGARGIKVDYIWSHENPEGLKNFIKWIEPAIEVYLKENPILRKQGKRLEVGRKDVDKNFNPDNCEIRPFGETTHLCRRSTTLDREKVIELRRLKRMNPDVTLEELGSMYDVSGATISRALHGVTWACVNDTEKPLSLYDDGDQEQPVIHSGLELATETED
jgi:hypothetical protein